MSSCTLWLHTTDYLGTRSLKALLLEAKRADMCNRARSTCRNLPVLLWYKAALKQHTR